MGAVIIIFLAPIAQLDRAQPCGGCGWGFESLWARILIKPNVNFGGVA